MKKGWKIFFFKIFLKCMAADLHKKSEISRFPKLGNLEISRIRDRSKFMGIWDRALGYRATDYFVGFIWGYVLF